MEWKTTEKGYRVPIYTEEEKRNHVPHWCSDVITEELTPELIKQREEDAKMLDNFFAKQEAKNQTTDL